MRVILYFGLLHSTTWENECMANVLKLIHGFFSCGFLPVSYALNEVTMAEHENKTVGNCDMRTRAERSLVDRVCVGECWYYVHAVLLNLISLKSFGDFSVRKIEFG